MKRYFIILGATLLLSACASPFGKNGEPLAQMTFDQVNAKSLYVASYDIVGLPANVDKEPLPKGFIIDPEQLVLDYLNNRFEAAGNQGKLAASIMGISVVHKVIDSQNTLGAMFGVYKTDNYRVTVSLDISAYGTRSFAKQKQSLTVFRDISISEHVSLVNREEIQILAMDNMLDDLDIALGKIFKDQFQILR